MITSPNSILRTSLKMTMTHEVRLKTIADIKARMESHGSLANYPIDNSFYQIGELTLEQLVQLIEAEGTLYHSNLTQEEFFKDVLKELFTAIYHTYWSELPTETARYLFYLRDNWTDSSEECILDVFHELRIEQANGVDIGLKVNCNEWAHDLFWDFTPIIEQATFTFADGMSNSDLEEPMTKAWMEEYKLYLKNAIDLLNAVVPTDKQVSGLKDLIELLEGHMENPFEVTELTTKIHHVYQLSANEFRAHKNL